MRSAVVTVSLARYAIPWERQRMQLTTSRWPSRLRPLSNGITNCPGIITNWPPDLFFKEGRFDEAHASVERAKPHAAIDDPYYLACATQLQARFWYGQGRFGEAKSGALGAADIFERSRAAKDLEKCRALLRGIEKKRES